MRSKSMLVTLATAALGALAVILLFVALTVALVWWRQERIAYQPPTENPTPPSRIRRVEYAAADGQRLYGYLIEPVEPAGASSGGVVVAFHGNADLATWQIPWGEEIARRTGWRVLLAEYRGYGGLGGTPTYGGLQQDARAAWMFATVQLMTPSRQFAVFGHSLGSAIAVELAAELSSTGAGERPDVLLLQSPFTSARDMTRIVSSRPVQLLWDLIARVHYDTRSRLATLDIPIWIAHGERDWLVPVGMGRELHARTRHAGRLFLVRGAGHNDVAELGGEAYWRWLSEALTTLTALTARAEVSPAVPRESTRRIGTSD